MKASELRVNNYYFSTKFNTVVKCEMSDFCEIYKRADGAEPGEDEINSVFKPIPLTEEWLLELGFKHWETSEGIQKEYFIHDKLPDKMTYYLPYFNMNIYIKDITIQYVHQLQNLYFAITGKELTF